MSEPRTSKLNAPAIPAQRKSLLIVGLQLVLACSLAHGADFHTFEPTPLKAPDCLAGPSLPFFSENAQPIEPPHPTLPIGSYYMIVRYLGATAVTFPATSDFGHFPATYPWPPVRGVAVTGFTPPAPRERWQRARHANATVDDSSAFQLSCYDAGSFLNTWTFPLDPTLTGGGPHAIYGYSFDDAHAPQVYDGSPSTDFVLQASVEIPWFAAWPDASAPPGEVPVGQTSLFAYFRDRTGGKTFALLLAIFDNRFTGISPYDPFTAHDGATPFASTPISANAKYGTLSPYSSRFTGTTWTGLRFFRMHVTPANFGQVIADVNAYCRDHRAQRHCSDSTSTGEAYSTSITNYEITDFGVLHEIFRNPDENLSMGLHVYDLGAWTFR